MNKLLVGVVVVVVLSSCSRDIELSDFCESYDALVICKGSQACGDAPSDVSCEDLLARSQRSGNCLPRHITDSLDNGWLGYDAHAARTCLDTFSTQCTRDIDTCTRTYLLARRAVGEQCFSSYDCIEGACQITAPECPGTCVPLGGVGPQVDGDNGCRAGLAIVFPADGGGYACVAPVAHGAVCQRPGERTGGGRLCIEPGDFCSRALDGGAGTCQSYPASTLIGRGELCIDRGPCQLGLACRDDGRCGALIARGESCRLDSRGCQVGSTCVADTCVPLRTRGQACGYEITCQAPLRCLDSICAPPGSEGEACHAFNSCQEPLECIDGTCAQRLCR